MANEEQLAILKQGVDVWNEWRKENPNERIDFSNAILIGSDLISANLNETNFNGVNLSGSSLSNASLLGASLRRANLWKVDFNNADLRNTDLREADLREAELSNAVLREAMLTGAVLKTANLSEADLTETDLTGADLSGAYLRGSNFEKAWVLSSSFIEVDLSRTIGLNDVNHLGPSRISTDTFVLSNGKIPEIFLRGCGLSEWEIEMVKLYDPNLSNEEVNNIQHKTYKLRSSLALQISPLFISYSHADKSFVDKLDTCLTQKSIRFWRDIHDMKAGRMEKQIDRAIRQNPTVLLVLSEHSISSDWVEHEVRTARQLEKDIERDVLCPIALDNSWKSSHWPKRVMEQIMEYNILDFSEWRNDTKFKSMFRKLIDGLELFYKG